MTLKIEKNIKKKKKKKTPKNNISITISTKNQHGNNDRRYVRIALWQCCKRLSLNKIVSLLQMLSFRFPTSQVSFSNAKITSCFHQRRKHNFVLQKLASQQHGSGFNFTTRHLEHLKKKFFFFLLNE